MSTVHTVGKRVLLCLSAALIGAASLGLAATPKSDAEIAQAIISESIASYRGNCPCPYNTDRAGRRCGARSAYSRPGGASPTCYAKDVTQRMIDEYRKRKASESPAAR